MINEDDLFGQVDSLPVEEEEVSQIDDYGFKDENQEEPEVKEEVQDYLTKFLNGKGINRNAISITEEDGTVTETTFDDLSDEEKIALLNEDISNPLDDNEIAFINYLRSNNLSVQDYNELIQRQVLEAYNNQPQEPIVIDSLDDDSLFCYDLIRRFGDELSDDEVNAQLEQAKANPEMFKKQVDLIRKQRTAEENNQRENIARQQEEYAEAERRQIQDALVGAAERTSFINGVDLEDNDRESVLDFLLTRNLNGQTGFSTYIQNPDNLFKLAWFAKHGEEAFQSVVDHFKSELTKARRGDGSPNKPRVVTRRSTKENDPYELDKVFK